LYTFIAYRGFESLFLRHIHEQPLAQLAESGNLGIHYFKYIY